MFGGGGMNPRKMKQMMKQMGIDVTELEAEEVIIRTADEELVFTGAQVTRMDAQGQETYQIVGDPESRPRGEGGSASAVESGDDAVVDVEGEAAGAEIPDSDIQIVAQRAGVGKDEAREALEAENGDLAAAIARLE
ncbi:Nascent polypeptide associated complex NAC [Halogranum rubrum]|uniref:Nascent polypeptide-associated complex protein n=1 Tax=Halogranum rubrum TaxID=553466 RepID=A0A1I4F9B9_9EURY|nr:nascent polypeptide-associated complex protein [Halogranum rubrum]SFL13900.1 Nascent polypeptide associated complex NAC [Halogranum rubrum]